MRDEDDLLERWLAYPDPKIRMNILKKLKEWGYVYDIEGLEYVIECMYGLCEKTKEHKRVYHYKGDLFKIKTLEKMKINLKFFKIISNCKTDRL